MPQKWFSKGRDELARAALNWTSDTYRLMLCNAFTINPDTQQFWSDISSNEVTGTGYAANGANGVIGTKSIVRNDAAGRSEWQGANVSFNAVGGALTAQVIVVVKWTGTPSTSVLVGYDDKGSPQTRTNDNWVAEFSGGIVMTIKNP